MKSEERIRAVVSQLMVTTVRPRLSEDLLHRVAQEIEDDKILFPSQY